MPTPTIHARHLLIAAALASGPVALPRTAQAAPPAGSYQDTCYVITADEANHVILTANCRRKETDWLGGNTHVYNQNWSYKYCLGDISNQDGYLSCTFDKARFDAEQQVKADKAALDAAVKQATPAFSSAMVTVYGHKASEAEIRYETSLMRASQPAAADGISYPEAFAWLKSKAAKPDNSYSRAAMIDAAFREVHGRPATAVEQAAYDAQVRAQQAWFTIIVGKERDKLNADPKVRAGMITTNYKFSFGREPTAGELGYWQGRKDSFWQMIAANRNWLYSTDGAAELTATIKRAKLAQGQPASDDVAKKSMPVYSINRRLFAEMK